MNAGTALVKFLAFLAQAAPEVVPVVQKAMCAWWGCNTLDLGPVPPDLRSFDAIDHAIDAELAKRK